MVRSRVVAMVLVRIMVMVQHCLQRRARTFANVKSASVRPLPPITTLAPWHQGRVGLGWQGWGPPSGSVCTNKFSHHQRKEERILSFLLQLLAHRLDGDLGVGGWVGGLRWVGRRRGASSVSTFRTFNTVRQEFFFII